MHAAVGARRDARRAARGAECDWTAAAGAASAIRGGTSVSAWGRAAERQSGKSAGEGSGARIRICSRFGRLEFGCTFSGDRLIDRLFALFLMEWRRHAMPVEPK